MNIETVKESFPNTFHFGGDRISTSKRRLSRSDSHKEWTNRTNLFKEFPDKSRKRSLGCKDSRLKYRSYLRAKLPERSLPSDEYNTKAADSTKMKKENERKVEHDSEEIEARPLKLYHSNNEHLQMFATNVSNSNFDTSVGNNRKEFDEASANGDVSTELKASMKSKDTPAFHQRDRICSQSDPREASELFC